MYEQYATCPETFGYSWTGLNADEELRVPSPTTSPSIPATSSIATTPRYRPGPYDRSRARTVTVRGDSTRPRLRVQASEPD